MPWDSEFADEVNANGGAGVAQDVLPAPDHGRPAGDGVLLLKRLAGGLFRQHSMP